MAYRSFDPDAFETATRAGAATRRGPEGELGTAESLAVAIGLRDAPSSLRSDGWLARWTRRLFGLGPKRPLADPRLESLRRLTVRLRHQPGRAAEEITTARLLGITDRQIAAIAARVRAPRSAAA